MRSAPTAIIVGGEPRKVVTIARSLHRRGVRCIVALGPDESLHVSSRAIAGVVQLQGDINEAAQLLCMLVKSEAAAWVAPTSDSSMNIVCAGYNELTRLCVVGCPSPQIVRRVLDKTATLVTAAKCGIPVPQSVAIADMSDLEATVSTMRFPIIAKPGDKNFAGASRARPHSFKTRRFDTADELRSAFFEQPQFGEGLIFQMYHRGHGVGIELLMHESAPVAAFQHRRLSENPPSGGVAVVAVSEPLDPRLLNYSVTLLQALQWEGVAMVEFRYDPATGDAALMEVNGRFWGSLPLAVKAGMDFPFYAWEVSRRRAPLVPSKYRTGLRVRWTAGSLKRFAHAFADQPERIRFGAAFVQLLADFRPGTRSAMWSSRDPLPAIQEVVRVLSQWVRDSTKRFIRFIVPAGALSIVQSARVLPTARRGIYAKRRIARVMGLEKRVSLPTPIRSIVFVCHGNIMRSASAAQFLRDDLNAQGIDYIHVTSAGTHARNGKAADPRVRQAAASMGVNLDEHRATLLTQEIVDSNDVIFAMDEFNFANIAMEFPRSRGKLMLFGGMTPEGVYTPHEIADPYTTGQAQVTETIGVVRGYVASLTAALVARRGKVAS